MLKKITVVFLSMLIILSVSVTAFAYEPNDFEVSAKAGLLISMDTEEILYEKNIDEKVYPASITKIMTAIVILESPKYNPEEKIAMTKEVNRYITGTGSAVSNLKVGEEITQLDLIYMILMSSYGDCAYLAALYYGDTVDNFVDMMNMRAQQMGMQGTHYGNPVGLHDEKTYTTVRDVYKVTSYALQNETFKTVCETKRYKVAATNMSGARTLSTTNFLQDAATNYYYPYARGVKTGFTNQAGRCLVSTASYNGYNYMCILMNCPYNLGKRIEFIDSKALYKWAFNNFEFKEVADSENPVCEMPVRLSAETDFVPLYIENGFVSLLPKDADSSTFKTVPHLSYEAVDAPVKKGQKLGTADIVYAEKVIGTVDLVAGNSVERSKVLLYVRTAKDVLSSVYMKIVYIIAAISVIIFIIMIIRLNAGYSRRRKVKYIPYDKKKGNDEDED